MTPTMPLSHFEVLVKVQKTNGVKLIQGKHDGRAAKEYVSALMDAVEEKCAVILSSKHFMTVLSDGSQARKTKSDKEMVLVRIERNGLPCYLVASLVEMSEWGGTGAEALKAGIDNVFSCDGPFKMEDYETKLVGCTADGASVNFGRHNGLLTRLDEDRGWLIKIHCSNHRIELAIKDSFKQSIFLEVDNAYSALYKLCKNSGKIKTEIKKAAEALNVEDYTLPNLRGTRFIGHRITAYKALLNMWPAVITALQNVEAEQSTKSDVRSKVKGLLKKFCSLDFLCRTCVYLDLLEAVRPASKVFEDEKLMIYEVKNTVNETITELEEFCDMEDANEDLTSHFHRFYSLSKVKFFAPGDGRRKERNRSYTILDMSTTMKEGISCDSFEKNFEIKKIIASTIKDMLEDRFLNSYNDDIIESMSWFDLKNWQDEKSYGLSDFNSLYEHFKTPLDAAGYDHDLIKREWIAVRRHILCHFQKKDRAQDVWKKVLFEKRDEFPNVCLMVELVITFSGSNSTVERSFSLLTNMLSDRRLSMSHKTMNMLLKIKISDKLWNDIERKELIDRALEIFLNKRRRTRMTENEPARKKIRLEPNAEIYGKEVCEWVDLTDSESESGSESDD